jgi:TatD DNase family protein
MIDTHCHLKEDFEATLQRAFEKGISHVINICIDLKDIERAQKIFEKYPQAPFMAAIHPCDAHKVEEGHFELICQLAQEGKLIGIGESGLDLYHAIEHLEIQKKFFRQHVELANDLNLPLAIHCRNAFSELIEFVKNNPIHKGILHCFSGNLEQALWALEHDFILSISGVITFKNAHSLHEVVEKIPLEKLVVETDAPWLAPEPFRGKHNEPSYIPYIVQKIADLKGLPFEEVATQLDINTKRVFLL